MRIAIASWNGRRVGGVETYLSSIIPELHRVGHSVAFLHEIDEQENRERIPLPSEVPTWCVTELGTEQALAGLRDWQPDLIYTHGLHDPDLEIKLLQIAPAVFFAHGYYGTCISGSKTFKNPVVMPCTRRFGWQCLFYYFPRQCGGRSPATMLKQYRIQSKRLELLSVYKAIVTHSDHMRKEYLKHGMTPARIHKIVFPVADPVDGFQNSFCVGSTDRIAHSQLNGREAVNLFATSAETQPKNSYRLLFIGRMDFLKGGRVLLEALPQVKAALDHPLRVTFAGDGPDRRVWEDQAADIREQNEGLHIEFVGWLQSHNLGPLLTDSDLLVVPSLWPEPFGLAGPEAGYYGVPVAAFDVGGISDWLIDGVNGYLAPGVRPTAVGLAEAIVKCLHNPIAHSQLRRGAIEMSRRLSMEKHISDLLSIFAGALERK